MAYVGTKDGGLGGSPFLNGVHPTPRNKHRKVMKGDAQIIGELYFGKVPGKRFPG